MQRTGRLQAFAIACFAGAAFAAATAAPVRAETPDDRVWISADIEFELQGDFFPSRKGSKRSTNVYLEAFPFFTFHLTRRLTLTWEPKIEEISEPGQGETQVFQEQSIFTDQLYLAYALPLAGIGPAKATARVYGGKFTPVFGRAWQIAPGIYADSYSFDYQYEERIGVGGEVEITGGGWGHHVLQGSVFFLDTSILSESMLWDQRGRRRLSDGGVSNTGRLNSFIMSWTATRMPGIPGLEVQAALAYQSPGTDGTTAEIGLTGGVRYTRKFGPFFVRPYVEVVHLYNADGIEGRTRLYVMASLEAGWRRWVASVAALVRNTTDANAADEHDFLFTVSAGYRFAFGLGANIAYVYRNQDHVSQNGVGFLLTYNCRFALATRNSTFSCRGE